MAKNLKLHYKRWMSYAAARMTAREQKIRSRYSYYRWWDQVQPVGMPKFPDRVYISEWKGWNDFLGNNNVWIPKGSNIKYWSYFDALRWTQKQGFKRVDEWMAAYNKGKIPKEIPKWPDRYYKEWVNWSVFLGLRIEDKIAAAKLNTSILAICTPRGLPGGYILPIIAPEGEQQLRSMLVEHSSPQVLKLYVWEIPRAGWFNHLLSSVGSQQPDGYWLVNNVHHVIAELDATLLWWRPNPR